jgi:hypothetical protein
MRGRRRGMLGLVVRVEVDFLTSPKAGCLVLNCAEAWACGACVHQGFVLRLFIGVAGAYARPDLAKSSSRVAPLPAEAINKLSFFF